MPDYNVQGEKFRVVVPSGYATNQDWGLLVWISPENQAQVPEALLSQLASRRLLLVSAYKSGNDRHPLDRFRLALDATCNMCRGYPVDRNRIYIGGFSGGSRIASMLGVAYGDLYSGTLCLCGVNFYRPVRGAEGEEYPATFDPDPSALARAKRLGRFALVTGETDPNRPGTRALTQSGFKREGFRNVLYLEVKGMGHAVPNTEKLIAALNFLDPARASQP
jgi:predicted esterase